MNLGGQVEVVEIRADGVFPVATRENDAQATIDNDTVFGDVEEKV